ncbi:MAG: YdgA family protein [Sedimenticola sp.]
MKKFFVLFVLLVAVLLAIPGYVGYQAQARYQVLVDRLEMSGFRVSKHVYQRGWFGATAESDFALPIPASGPNGENNIQEFGFTINSDVVHGPLMPAGGIGLAEINTRILVDGKNVFPDDYPAKIQTRVAWNGAGETLVDLPATVIPAQQKRPQIDFGGMNGQMVFDAGFSKLDTTLKMPGLEISEGEAKRLVVQGVRADSKSWLDESGLMLGSGMFEVDRFELVMIDTLTSVIVEKIGADVDSSKQGENVSGTITYRLESADVNGERYGPAVLELSMANLPAEVLVGIQQGMEEIQRQQLPQNQQAFAAMTLLMSNGPKLIQSDPRFSIDRLSVKTPRGDIQGRFTIQPVGLQWQEISNVQAVVEKLEAEAELSMPEPFFRFMFVQQVRNQIAQQLEMRRQMGEEVEMPEPHQLDVMADSAAEQQLQRLISQEVLVRDGDLLSTRASLSSGLLTVNGKSVPLPVPGAAQAQ